MYENVETCPVEVEVRDSTFPGFEVARDMDE